MPLDPVLAHRQVKAIDDGVGRRWDPGQIHLGLVVVPDHLSSLPGGNAWCDWLIEVILVVVERGVVIDRVVDARLVAERVNGINARLLLLHRQAAEGLRLAAVALHQERKADSWRGGAC